MSENYSECRRLLQIMAVELRKNEKLSLGEIAKRVGVNKRTIIRWLKQYNSKGVKAFETREIPSKISDDDLAELIRILRKGALNYGFSEDTWTQKRVCSVIWQEFKIRYSMGYISALLARKNYSIRSSKTHTIHFKKILSILQTKNATEYGFESEEWTQNRAVELGEKLFDIKYDLGSLTYFLRYHGWSFRKHKKQLKKNR